MWPPLQRSYLTAQTEMKMLFYERVEEGKNFLTDEPVFSKTENGSKSLEKELRIVVKTLQFWSFPTLTNSVKKCFWLEMYLKTSTEHSVCLHGSKFHPSINPLRMWLYQPITSCSHRYCILIFKMCLNRIWDNASQDVPLFLLYLLFKKS